MAKSSASNAAAALRPEPPRTARRTKVIPLRDRQPEAAAEDGMQPKPARKRREQQRALDTKQAILNAALFEFAQYGYEAASIRNIAATTGLKHPLITYHYQNKELLWKAVALEAFTEIRRRWDKIEPDLEGLSPLERLRAEYFAFLRFTLSHPDFHHFMLRESRPDNPRQPWLVETILRPTMQRLLPQIEEAQAGGELPAVNPALVHYMMIGMTSVLSSLRDEIREGAGIVVDDAQVVDEYMDLLDQLVFKPARARGRRSRPTIR